MDDKVRRAIRVFGTLTDAQKRELLKSIKGYEEKGRLDESVRKEEGMIMGPLGGPCPYCGK